MPPPNPGNCLSVTDAFFALFRQEPRVPAVTVDSLAHAWRCLLNDPERRSALAGATHLRIAYAHPSGELQQAHVFLEKRRATTRLFLAAMDSCMQFGRGESRARALYALFMRMNWLLQEQAEDAGRADRETEPRPRRCSRAQIASAARAPLRLNFQTSDGQPFDPGTGPTRH